MVTNSNQLKLKNVEQQTGQPVIMAENRAQLSRVVTDLIMDAEGKQE